MPILGVNLELFYSDTCYDETYIEIQTRQSCDCKLKMSDYKGDYCMFCGIKLHETKQPKNMYKYVINKDVKLADSQSIITSYKKIKNPFKVREGDTIGGYSVICQYLIGEDGEDEFCLCLRDMDISDDTEDICYDYHKGLDYKSKYKLSNAELEKFIDLIERYDIGCKNDINLYLD